MTGVNLQAENAALKQRITELEHQLAHARQQQQHCEQNVALLQTIFDQLPAELFVLDRQGYILLANPFFAETLQRDPQQLIGMHQQQLFAQETLDLWQQEDAYILATSAPVAYEHTLVHHGISHTHLVTRFPLTDASGTINAIVGYGTDVTERKLLEETVRESEERLQQIIHNSDDIVLVHDQEGAILYCNAPERYGVHALDIVGKKPADFFPPDEANRLVAQIQQVAASGTYTIFENTVTWKDQTHFFLDHTYPIQDAHNQGTSVARISHNITERKQIEQALAQSHDMLKAVLDSAAEGIALFTREQGIVQYNRRFAHMWKLPEDWDEASNWNDLSRLMLTQIHDAWTFVGRVEALDTTSEAETTDLIDFKDGRFFEHRTAPYRIGTGIAGRVWSFLDVTDRVRAERELRESEEKYRTIADFTYDWEYWRGADGQYLYSSPACERISGYPCVAFFRRPGVAAAHHPSRRPRNVYLLSAT